MSAGTWAPGRHAAQVGHHRHRRQQRSWVAVLGTVVSWVLVWTVAHPGPLVLALLAVLFWASGLDAAAMVFVLTALLVIVLEALVRVIRGEVSR